MCVNCKSQTASVLAVVRTCDLTHGEVVPDSALRVQGCPLDAVGGACLQVLEGHGRVSGVDFEAAAGALPDDAQDVEDRMLHPGPVHMDGAVVRGGGDQLRCQHRCGGSK